MGTCCISCKEEKQGFFLQNIGDKTNDNNENGSDKENEEEKEETVEETQEETTLAKALEMVDKMKAEVEEKECYI